MSCENASKSENLDVAAAGDVRTPRVGQHARDETLTLPVKAQEILVESKGSRPSLLTEKLI
jgi:hypothetical protein